MNYFYEYSSIFVILDFSWFNTDIKITTCSKQRRIKWYVILFFTSQFLFYFISNWPYHLLIFVYFILNVLFYFILLFILLCSSFFFIIFVLFCYLLYIILFYFTFFILFHLSSFILFYLWYFCPCFLKVFAIIGRLILQQIWWIWGKFLFLSSCVYIAPFFLFIKLIRYFLFLKI